MEKLLLSLLALTSVILRVEATCIEGGIRLVDGANNHQGRVEVCHNNVWGTVCDDSWNRNDGIVACRQLGLRFVRYVDSAYFGRGTGQIWLDDLYCTGSESRLIDCTHNGFGVHNCGHREDAGLFCEAALVVTTCTEGKIRLVNGFDNFEGRVEVCHNNEWGTICDDSWSANDGIVACRQLGLSYVSVTTNAYYGQGDGQIWLEHLSCTGSENRLTDCSHNGFGSHSCGHHEDAGLVCNNGTSCVEGDVRLVDGTDQFGGRVEICHFNVWGSICSDSWSRNDGIVACHQLGLPYLRISTYTFHRQGSGRIWLSDVQCSGSETGLTSCTHSGFDVHHCSDVAGVHCVDTGTTDAVHSPLRLTYGSNQYEGRVEVYYDGEWGTVCDDGWGVVDANVVCHQLGFGDAIRAYRSSYFGSDYSSMPIWLDNVLCTIGDRYLSECNHNGWGSHDCTHSEDAGVACTGSSGTCTEGNIRLMDGTNNHEGRVEVCHSNVWGTVCSDYWSSNDGIVACRQLGLQYIATTTNAYFLSGTGQIWLDNVLCTGSESQLIDCSHNGFGSHNCDHSEDAGVVCGSYGELRLTDGTSSHGTLMFQLNDGSWGMVCSSGFDWRAANVACNQLGYDYGDFITCGGDYYHYYYYYCQSSYEPAAICYTSCTGYETSLSSCYIEQNCSYSNSCSSGNVLLSCYYYRYTYYNYDDDDSDGLSAGAIAGISVGSAVFLIIIIIFLIVTFVFVGRRYVKQQSRIVRVRNPDVVAIESCNTLPPYSTQPPVYISTQPTSGSYAMNSDFVTTPPYFDDGTEPLPEYTPSKPPPDYASTPPTQDVVQ